ncbi:MAG: cysteine synthase A [Clostridia bacterium]|nr:cysteine synthase A [Clostridia bacterium]
MQYQNMTDAIGNTPLIRLGNIEKAYNLKAKLYAKVEALNPAGSAKDRAVMGMIRQAVIEGKLKPGATLIEPTSGNTGIAMAAIAANMGYKAVIVMPDSMSVERIKLMKVYGAEVILTPGKEGMSGSIKKAEELCANTENSMILGQFDNKANAREHYRTTGPEIYRDLGGKISAFIAGVGTGGTFTGVSAFLKECIDDVKCIAVEPAASPMLSEGKFGAHKIQGIGANFVPGNYNGEFCDEIITVPDEKALEMFRLLPRKEGIFAGISSGAALAAAIEVGQRKEYEAKNIVVVFTDTGDRYLSVVSNE